MSLVPGLAARKRTLVLLNIASVVERADEQVLPAVYLFIGRSLHATPAQLGTLTLCRALVQALSSPVSGVLGDKVDRTHIVALGCFLWGVMTAAIGMSHSLHQAMIYSGMNGIGLALVVPCVQSLIADYTLAERRGAAFGVLYFTGAIGGLIGGFFATNLGRSTIAGIEGWRCAFHLVALVSLITSGLTLWLAVDPRRKLAGLISPLNLGATPTDRYPEDAEHAFQTLKLPGMESPRRKSLRLDLAPLNTSTQTLGQVPTRRVWEDVLSVMRIRTFQIIVLQGIVGSMPWNAMVFITLWLQLLGFSDFAASLLMALFALGSALGGLLGGAIGDWAAKTAPDRGRIMAAQFSVACGLPLSIILLKGLPTEDAHGFTDSLAPSYAVVMALFGLLISWCGSANSAIFAEIVPDNLRSVIYAFDRSFEGAVAACGMPLVGIIAERGFHFEGHLAESHGDALKASANAKALANALLVCLVVPWTLCVIAYTGLYRHYPRDRRRAGNAVTTELKVMGSSPRPSPAAPVIVEVASGTSGNRLAPRAGHTAE
ncbi:hypothetical protein CVIRNUC_007153 [Coccomyxa viridis]|uniref:Major facilitator superfamily (MFS) profile domain-containing protein n=1 Tax=Coccomyxa viridis TaxID=1274662 RepID=A0AAV1ID59_9CHLO|nr:hypothetical protein CVIRNUC_007153 [Coccomyxa viridis]